MRTVVTSFGTTLALIAVMVQCQSVSKTIDAPESAISTVTAQWAVAEYAAQELQCVNVATSREQADTCIAAVRQRWCAPGSPLAGSCVADGGRE